MFDNQGTKTRFLMVVPRSTGLTIHKKPGFLVSTPRACFQTLSLDLDPPKSPLTRGTLTKFSLVIKGWGGSKGLKTRPRMK